MNPTSRPSAVVLAVVVLLAVPALLHAAEVPANLARAKGARAIGSGSNGPFAIAKLNDGRLDPLGMWSSDGRDGAFGGIQLGDAPVMFNAIRFYLFNGRASFTGWRLESADDVEIDEDPESAEAAGERGVGTRRAQGDGESGHRQKILRQHPA